MATPLFVTVALAKVQENGNVDMSNREAVEALVSDPRAEEWLFKASDSQYAEALRDTAAYISDDFVQPEPEADPDDDDYERHEPFDGFYGY